MRARRRSCCVWFIFWCSLAVFSRYPSLHRVLFWWNLSVVRWKPASRPDVISAGVLCSVTPERLLQTPQRDIPLHSLTCLITMIHWRVQSCFHPKCNIHCFLYHFPNRQMSLPLFQRCLRRQIKWVTDVVFCPSSAHNVSTASPSWSVCITVVCFHVGYSFLSEAVWTLRCLLGSDQILHIISLEQRWNYYEKICTCEWGQAAKQLALP